MENKFNEFESVTTLAGVKAFANYLLMELHVNFHPDDDFNDYINHKTGCRSFTRIRAERLNRRMAECFSVCRDAGADICEEMDVITPYILGAIKA